MKQLIILIGLALMGCGGSLSDEQRRRIKEDMAQHKIVRITDAEITATAFEQGRKVIKALSYLKNDTLKLDSLRDAYHATIRWIAPGAKNALAIEQQLIEAYLISSINGGIQDNIQRLGTDSLLYTFPLTEKLPDGSENVLGMWSVAVSKKDLILSMNK